MTGWRGRIGLIVPSSNTTAEPEFREHAPEGVEVYGARMRLASVTVDELDAMSDDAMRAASLLSDADVDTVAYGCTTGSLLHGPGFDAELEAELADVAGVPAVATALSVDRALNELGAQRIAVVTPYTADLDERERSYLTAAGYEVVSIDGRGLTANTDIGWLSPADAYRQTRSAVDQLRTASTDTAVDEPIDAVFISCTNYQTMAVLDRLQADLGMPVISSNSATLWDVCRTLGVDADIHTLE